MMRTGLLIISLWSPFYFYLTWTAPPVSIKQSVLPTEAMDCDCDTSRERIFLSDLYFATNGENWDPHTNWSAPDKKISEWFGIDTMFLGCVASLDLDGTHEEGGAYTNDTLNNNLVGVLPAIFELPFLERLSMPRSKLACPIPEFSCNGESKLKELYFKDAQLIGPIPESLVRIRRLEKLFLQNNFLEGAIPPAIAADSLNLESVYLHYNQLSGPVPNFAEIPTIRNLYLSYNAFTFADLIPHFQAIKSRTRDFKINNQAKVFKDTTYRVGVGLPLTIDLLVDENVPGNYYNWFKYRGTDSIPYVPTKYENKLRFKQVKKRDEGTYFCKINNAAVEPLPGNGNETFLTLYTHNITIETCTPEIQYIDSTLCSGDTLFVDGLPFTNASDTLLVKRGAATNGCDSAYFVRLQFKNSMEILEEVLLCPGDSHWIAAIDQSISTAGLHTFDYMDSRNTCVHLEVDVQWAEAAIFQRGEVPQDEVLCQADFELVLEDLDPRLDILWEVTEGPAVVLDERATSTWGTDLKAGLNRFRWQIFYEDCLIESGSFSITYIASPEAENDYFDLAANQVFRDDLIQNDDLANINNWRVEIVQSPQNGQLILLPDGQFNYTPSRNYLGTDQFTYALYSETCMEFSQATAILNIIPQLEDADRQANVITPNEDGFNDFFELAALRENPTDFPNNRMVIFNLFGQVVFDQSNYQNNWNGQDQWSQQDLLTDTYFYRFIYDGNPKGLSGVIIVLREKD
ncbi:MAG: gliding motility-associated C-terminal domain-containing protein [Bacteroidota bacterium]